MGQAIGALRGSFQGAAPRVGLSRTHAQFQSSLERCQRCAQLMGGIGNELRLALELLA
ncbi:hypothetical protein D3C72_2060430 [compost metagenome]